jgi:hypothetical protein
MSLTLETPTTTGDSVLARMLERIHGDRGAMPLSSRRRAVSLADVRDADKHVQAAPAWVLHDQARDVGGRGSGSAVLECPWIDCYIHIHRSSHCELFPSHCHVVICCSMKHSLSCPLHHSLLPPHPFIPTPHTHPLEQIASLEDIFRELPLWMGLDVELKFPLSDEIEPTEAYCARNRFMDAILKVVCGSVGWVCVGGWCR